MSVTGFDNNGGATETDFGAARATDLAMRIALAMVPRCGSASLFDVYLWRQSGMKLGEIAIRVGITKAAVWSAIRKAEHLVATTNTYPFVPPRQMYRSEM